jgi:hypothetical protein
VCLGSACVEESLACGIFVWRAEGQHLLTSASSMYQRSEIEILTYLNALYLQVGRW